MKAVEQDVCVFDLDGTLWKVNSHVDIVEQYYGFNQFGKWSAKIIARVFPRSYMKWLNQAYTRIPRGYVMEYSPSFRVDALSVLQEQKQLGKRIVVISNAPEAILEKVGQRLQVSVFHAKVRMKDIVLLDAVGNWKSLMVITDNLTDESILRMADEAIIYTTPKRKKQFVKLELPERIEFRSNMLE